MVIEDRGPELLAVIWVFTALAIMVVFLKIITRAHLLHGLGPDDFLILFSLLLIVICTSIFTYDVHLGMGKHAVDVAPDQLSTVIKLNLVANPLGIMAYSFPNISVSILVNRLLPPNTLRTIGLFALSISQCVIAAVSCVLLFVQCLPPESLWNPAIPHTCFARGTVSRYSYFVGAFTAMTDVVLGMVPCLAFWHLQLPVRTKVGLCFLMGGTLLAAACAVVKTTKLNELDDLGDFTFGTVDLIIWAIIEANAMIVAASIPTLRPFFHHALNRKSRGKGTGGTSGLFKKGTSKNSGALLLDSDGRPTPWRDGHQPSARTREQLTHKMSARGVMGWGSQNAIVRTTDLTVSFDNQSQVAH